MIDQLKIIVFILVVFTVGSGCVGPPETHAPINFENRNELDRMLFVPDDLTGEWVEAS